MTNQETLTKAIEKAIAGGWKPPFFAEPVVVGVTFEDYKTRIRFGSISDGETMAVEEIIFNHDFAKALWNYDDEQEIETSEINDQGHEVIERWKEKYPAWKFHLQQMVIADDPIKYLSENL